MPKSGYTKEQINAMVIAIPQDNSKSTFKRMLVSIEDAGYVIVTKFENLHSALVYGPTVEQLRELLGPGFDIMSNGNHEGFHESV